MKLKNLILLLTSSMAALYACSNGSSASNGSAIQYTQLIYTGSLPPGGSTGLAGVRQVGNTNNVYIAGCYILPTITYGTLYVGPVTGGGTYYTYTYPGLNVITTTAYSVDNADGSNINLVGTYTTESNSNHGYGFYYHGPVTNNQDPSNWEEINFPESGVLNTYPHSVMGNLIVGNYDSPSTAGNGFIYTLDTKTYKAVSYPGSVYTSIYGVWWNGGNSYTLTGGYSNSLKNIGSGTLGFVVDYNPITEQFTNWTSYSYNNASAAVTHFEGITTDGSGGYNLAAGSLKSGVIYASFVHINRNSDGSFNRNATWVNVWYPGAEMVTADTVYQNYLLGEYENPGESMAYTYTATVSNTFYTN